MPVNLYILNAPQYFQSIRISSDITPNKPSRQEIRIDIIRLSNPQFIFKFCQLFHQCTGPIAFNWHVQLVPNLEYHEAAFKNATQYIKDNMEQLSTGSCARTPASLLARLCCKHFWSSGNYAASDNLQQKAFQMQMFI